MKSINVHDESHNSFSLKYYCSFAAYLCKQGKICPAQKGMFFKMPEWTFKVNLILPHYFSEKHLKYK